MGGVLNGSGHTTIVLSPNQAGLEIAQNVARVAASVGVRVNTAGHSRGADFAMGFVAQIPDVQFSTLTTIDCFGCGGISPGNVGSHLNVFQTGFLGGGIIPGATNRPPVTGLGFLGHFSIMDPGGAGANAISQQIRGSP